MARILVLTHEFDDFAGTEYLIKGLLGPWQEMGHSVHISRGIPSASDADIVIVHTDLSVVPEEYSRFAAQFPAGVNRKATDIRKRLVSRALLGPGEQWDGPVIVKSDLNAGGFPEGYVNLRAWERHRPPPYASHTVVSFYPIFPSMASLPEAVWNEPSVVVERFLPEFDAKGFWLRCWVFFGDAERCNRFCSAEPIVKGSNIISRESVPVPDELRAERARLGFDYGKFDFVVHNGRAVLLDANRTPTGVASISHHQDSEAPRLARGIEALLAGPHAR